MVGNRSRLYAEHPDWVVTDRASGKPIAPMTFYGEFRWHKRSEEYYVLDITHPAAEAYMRKVFRTWARDWGCGYFKTDFMYLRQRVRAARRRAGTSKGLSRIEIWMRMARLIREEIGDALWLGCGGPIWAGIGLVDAVRIGRDIGVSWEGHYSAESLLRDQTSRNFGNGIFWQADPDCILLRERFHHLTDEQVRSLALFAGLAGGVLMTSDRLDEISDERARLFADLARESRPQPCDFPQLGRVPLRHRIGTVAHRRAEADVGRRSRVDAAGAQARRHGTSSRCSTQAARRRIARSMACASRCRRTRRVCYRANESHQRAAATLPGFCRPARPSGVRAGAHQSHRRAHRLLGGFVLPASLALGTWTVAAPRDDRNVRVLSEGQHETEMFPLDVTPKAATQALERLRRRRDMGPAAGGVQAARRRSAHRERRADGLGAEFLCGARSLRRLRVAHGRERVAVAARDRARVSACGERVRRRPLRHHGPVRCDPRPARPRAHARLRGLLLAELRRCRRRIAGSSPTRWFEHAFAHGEYNVRRAESEELVDYVRRRIPQRTRLAELSVAETNELMSGLPATLARRLRHIVGENRRVHEAYAALTSGNVALLGQLLFASHESLRTDYEVSCRELDVLVEIASGVPGVARCAHDRRRFRRLHAHAGGGAARRESAGAAALELCTKHGQGARYIYM